MLRVVIDGCDGSCQSQAPSTEAVKARTLRPRALHERVFALFSAFVSHGIMVLLVVWIPAIVQLAVIYARHLSVDPAWLAVEAYGIACLTAFALFAELLKESKQRRVGPILHAYNTLLHWFALLGALTCVLAMVVISFDPDGEIAVALSQRPMVAVLIAAIVYLSYEIPALWEATELLEHPIIDPNTPDYGRCVH